MKILVLYSVSFFLALASSGFAQDNNTFVLKHFPIGPEGDCQSTAEVMTSEVTTLLGRRAFSVYCERDIMDYEYGGENIVFHLDGPVPAFTSYIDIRYPKRYFDQTECNNDLDQQSLLFQQQTGLSLISTYCSPGGFLHLYGLGTSEIKRHVFNHAFDGEYGFRWIGIEDPRALAEQLRQALEAQGVVVARSIVSGDQPLVDYYRAGPRLPLENIMFGHYLSAADCAADLENVATLIRHFRGNVLVQFCAPSETMPDPARSAFAFVLAPHHFFFPQIEHLYLKTSPFRAASFEECQRKKAEVAHYYNATLNHDVYGVQCSLTDSRQTQYSLLVFSRARR